MSGVYKEPTQSYTATRSTFSSSNQRYSPLNGKSSNKSCFKCGQEGHFSRACPQNQNKSSNDGACFKCGEQGHYSRSCPNKSRKSSSSYSLKSNTPSNDMGIKYGQPGAGLTPINWDTITLLPFQKDFYTPTNNTNTLTNTFIDEWKKEHDIECFHGYQETISDNNNNNNWNKNWMNAEQSNKKKKKINLKPKPIPNPIMKFTDTSFPPIIMKAITKSGFESPTPIQSSTWPMVLSGNNVIGIARTGSGKTLAFLLPAVVHILSQPRVKRGDGPIAIIIAPTRELACQIEGEVVKFASSISHCCVYGGVKKWEQRRKLLAGVSIIIATPGRLLDFLECEITNFKRVTYCVIDEADRLLDMGFEPQLNSIMNQIRPDRQMMMFSATWPKEVRQLAKKYMVNNDDDSNIFQVAIGGSMSKLNANKDVKQEIKFMEKTEKINILKKLIDEYVQEDKNCKILVFISTKKMCNYMQQILWEDGYWVTCIHGDKEQKQRDRALSDFKTGKMKIMLATDVASRGIHVNDIKLVINFDFPTAIEDYVHRIGRTGRAGNKGLAISFFVEDIDGYRAKDLIKVLKDSKQEIPQQLLKYKSSNRGANRGYNKYRKQFYQNRNYNRRW